MGPKKKTKSIDKDIKIKKGNSSKNKKKPKNPLKRKHNKGKSESGSRKSSTRNCKQLKGIEKLKEKCQKSEEKCVGKVVKGKCCCVKREKKQKSLGKNIKT